MMNIKKSENVRRWEQKQRKRFINCKKKHNTSWSAKGRPKKCPFSSIIKNANPCWKCINYYF